MKINVDDVLNDINLAADLIAKIAANWNEAETVMSADQLATAKAQLAKIQAQGNELDAEFDAAVAEANGEDDAA